MIYRNALTLLGALALVASPALAPQALAQPAAKVESAAHQRLLPLQGGRNFRDLGGYRTQDGRTVKWGVLFRSGAMAGLTPADYTYLEKRGIRVVCDFRDTGERAAEPVNWPAAHAPKVLSDDYHLDMAQSLPKGDMAHWTAEEGRAAMATSYPMMLTQFNGQFRRMFGELLAHRVPLAFNCTAGKDRTGIAAALVLTSLGVPRETVIEDYLLTNRYLDGSKMMHAGTRTNNPSLAAMAKMPPEVLRAMMAADRSYIEAAFKVIDQHPGGADGYLRDEMGLSKADLTRLRSMYTQ
ncbi:tyrosine-protein phosphatase [Novosphingobium rosa]|uniref:tyrosine-protein phosphatase n=1 Tax=Novosphingobium rosa TaxID=76978 RepID=UPI0008329CC9|nr:tyrosine-protein phosphatase [Novosphingobium rosa]